MSFYSPNKPKPKDTIKVIGADALAETLPFSNEACLLANCECSMCKVESPVKLPKQSDNLTTNSARWLQQVLRDLCPHNAKSLKFFVADIIYLNGDILEIYRTLPSTGRVIRVPELIPTSQFVPTLIGYRQEFKTRLQQRFKLKPPSSIVTDGMHKKYFEEFVVPSFGAGIKGNDLLEPNISLFKNYVLHGSKDYVLHNIDDLKLNDKELFCTVSYEDGSKQIMNRKEFLNFERKIPAEVVCAQSHMRAFDELKDLFIVDYVHSEAEQEKLAVYQQQLYVLLGLVNRYEQGYRELDLYEYQNEQMMRLQPIQYAQKMTRLIVLYLAAVSGTHLLELTVKWLKSRLGMVCLYNVLHLKTSNSPLLKLRHLKVRKDSPPPLLQDSRAFLELYSELKESKQRANSLKLNKNAPAEISSPTRSTVLKTSGSIYGQNKATERHTEATMTSENTRSQTGRSQFMVLRGAASLNVSKQSSKTQRTTK